VNVERYAWLTIPVLAVLGSGLASLLWRARQDRRIGRNLSMLLVGLLLPAGVVYLTSLPRETFFYSPQLAPRYLLILAPASYVLLAWGIRRLAAPRPLRLLALAIAALAALYGLWSYYPARVLSDDYKSLANTLHAYQRDDDAVVLYTDKDWPVFAYYHPGEWFKIPHALQITPAEAQAHLEPVWSTHDGVWLVVTPYAGASDAQGEIPRWLNERAARVTEHRFDDKVLRFYARTEARARLAGMLREGVKPPHPLTDITDLAVGYEQALHTCRNGDTVHLFLYRRAGAPPVRIGLALQSDPGALTGPGIDVPGLTQTEDHLVRQQADLPVLPDVPPGRYVFSIETATGAAATFGRLTVRPWPSAATSSRDVSIASPLEVDFADGVHLLGYDLEQRTTTWSSGACNPAVPCT